MLLWQDCTDILVMHFPARTSPATLALSPQHTPTAPYPSAGILMNRTKMKRKQRRRQTQSSLKITAANTTTSRSWNISCTTPPHTSCSAMGWSRPQLPAPGIWTDQSQGPWLTAGAQHLRTTSHQAGPVSSARQRAPSLQMEISTRQSPLHGILWVCVWADTRRSQVRRNIDEKHYCLFILFLGKLLFAYFIKLFHIILGMNLPWTSIKPYAFPSFIQWIIDKLIFCLKNGSGHLEWNVEVNCTHIIIIL